MTKKIHVCDENCFHTTDEARELQLPTGSKVKSTRESADKAYEKQMEKVQKTKEFREKYKHPMPSTLKNDEFDRITRLIIDATNTRKTSGTLIALMQCLKNIENEDK